MVPFALFLFGLAAASPPGVASAVPFWTADQDISDGEVNDTFTSNNGQHFMAMDDSNNLYVTFFDNRFKVPNGDNNYEIFIRRFIYNFGSPFITRVTNAGNMSKYPAIAIRNWGAGDYDTQQDSGRVYIVWQDARLFPLPNVGEPKSYTIFMRTFRSMGGTGLGPEIQVSSYDSINTASLPVVTAGDSNRVWIAWQKPSDGTGTMALYARAYHSNTGVFDPIEQLTPGVSFAGSASIAASRNGVVHLVWVDTRNAGIQQIWTKRYVPGSGWTADEQLVFSSMSSAAPSITIDYNNHAHLVWVDRRDGNPEVYYKEYVPGTGWDALDTRITVNTFSQIQPYVDADPRGNVYTVWTDLRNGSSNPDIYYDTRHNGTWAGNTSIVGAGSDTTNSVQQFPGIVHDDFGAAYVAWTDERLPASIGKNRDVFYKTGLDVVTGVSTEKPSLARLLKNYPNPFNPVTRIQFVLDRDARVSLRVFDVHGRAVRTLVDSYLASGQRVVGWDGRDDGGRLLASGTYFVRLEGGGAYLSRTVNLIK